MKHKPEKQIVARGQHDFATGGQECFFMAGKELVQKSDGGIFYIYDREALG